MKVTMGSLFFGVISLEYTTSFNISSFPCSGVQIGDGNTRLAISMQNFSVTCIDSYVSDVFSR